MPTSIEDSIKSIQEQNQTISRALGLYSLSGTSAIEKLYEMQSSRNGINSLTNIAKEIYKKIEPLNASATILANSLGKQLEAMQSTQNSVAFRGLSSVLSELGEKNIYVSNLLSGFASSQIHLSNNLKTIADTLGQSHLNKFNSLNIALQGISNSYLKNIAVAYNWEDIAIANVANETIANIADGLLNNTTQVTKEDLTDLRESIITELSSLLAKTRADKAKEFIRDLIGVISLLLSLFAFYQSNSDISNKEVIIETKKELEKQNKDILAKIEIELNKFNHTRVAKSDVDLRYSDKKNSKIIGVVKVGQRVTVIEIRHLYLLVSYIDKSTNEPRSGFVIKKYFDRGDLNKPN